MTDEATGTATAEATSGDTGATRDTAIDTTTQTPPETTSDRQPDEALAALGVPAEPNGAVSNADEGETDKPAKEAEGEEATGEGQPKKLDDLHRRLAGQLGLTEEEIAAGIEQDGLDTFSRSVQLAAAAHTRRLNRQKGKATDKPAEGAIVPSTEPEKKADAIATSPSVDASKFRIPDDTDEAQFDPDTRARWNGMLDRNEQRFAALEAKLSTRDKEDSDAAAALAEVEQDEAADDFLTEQAKSFPEFGDKGKTEYAADSAEMQARKPIIEEAKKLLKLGAADDIDGALAMAFNNATATKARAAPSALRKERITRQRRAAAPSGTAGSGRRATSEQEADERLQAELEKKTGLIVPR